MNLVETARAGPNPRVTTTKHGEIFARPPQFSSSNAKDYSSKAYASRSCRLTKFVYDSSVGLLGNTGKRKTGTQTPTHRTSSQQAAAPIAATALESLT